MCVNLLVWRAKAGARPEAMVCFILIHSTYQCFKMHGVDEQFWYWVGTEIAPLRNPPLAIYLDCVQPPLWF